MARTRRASTIADCIDTNDRANTMVSPRMRVYEAKVEYPLFTITSIQSLLLHPAITNQAYREFCYLAKVLFNHF